MKRLVWSLVLASALFVAGAPEASAHGSHNGAYGGYDRYYVVRHGHHYPGWLRRHNDFHRWYRRSHYRYDSYLSWSRLFDIYHYERKYHRPYRYQDHHRDRHHRHYRHR
ncbi:MAG: hypothetical protein V3R21_09035 [Woeseiaceae bacterium]